MKKRIKTGPAEWIENQQIASSSKREKNTNESTGKTHSKKADACSFPHYTDNHPRNNFFFNIAARRRWLCVYEGYRIVRFFAVLPLTCKNRTHIFSLLLPVKKNVYSNWKKSKNKWIIIKCQFFERFLQAWSFFCVVPR